MNENDKLALQERIIEALKTVYDPEIPVNIYDLGLIYVRMRVEGITGITAATINLVFEPEWDKDMMSEEAKLELGFL